MPPQHGGDLRRRVSHALQSLHTINLRGIEDPETESLWKAVVLLEQ
jgi:hypothetical protein